MFKKIIPIYTGKSLPKEVKVLGAVSFFQDISSEMIYPIIPLFIAYELESPPLVIGIMEAFAILFLTVFKGYAGVISDKWDARKPFVVSGYSISTIAKISFYFVDSIGKLITFRIFDRIGKALRTAPRDALIAYTTPKQLRSYAFSFHRGLDHMGAAIGPLIGAYLLFLETDFRTIFLISSIPGLLGVIIAITSIKEIKGIKVKNIELSLSKHSLPYFLFSFSKASEMFLITYLASYSGISPIKTAILWSIFNTLQSIASIPSGKIANSLGLKKFTILCWSTTSIMLIVFVSSNIFIVPAYLLLALTTGALEGPEKALYLDMEKKTSKGASLGGYNLATSGGKFLSNLLLGALWYKYGSFIAFILIAFIALLGVALLSTYKHSTH